MRIIGETQASSDMAVPKDGPSFVYQDPGSQRLLFAREAWGLNVGVNVPAAAPEISVQAKGALDGAERLTALWEDAWLSYWAAISAVHEEARGDNVLGSKSTEVVDWEFAARPAHIPPNQFAEWQRAIPLIAPLGSRFVSLSEDAADAFERGLSSVFVLPVAGHWAMSTGGKLLLISPLVHESNLLLGRAFREFSGEPNL